MDKKSTDEQPDEQPIVQSDEKPTSEPLAQKPSEDVADAYLKELDERAGITTLEKSDSDIEALRVENDRLQRQLKAVSDAYVSMRREKSTRQAPQKDVSDHMDIDSIIKATRPTYSRSI